MTVQEWLAGRKPPIPGDFGRWMVPSEAGAPASVASLAREAEIALEAAASPEGRPRAGAFDLLAADGFLSYACEAALEEPDADAALMDLVRRFAG